MNINGGFFNGETPVLVCCDGRNSYDMYRRGNSVFFRGTHAGDIEFTGFGFTRVITDRAAVWFYSGDYTLFINEARCSADWLTDGPADRVGPVVRVTEEYILAPDGKTLARIYGRKPEAVAAFVCCHAAVINHGVYHDYFK